MSHLVPYSLQSSQRKRRRRTGNQNIFLVGGQDDENEPLDLITNENVVNPNLLQQPPNQVYYNITINNNTTQPIPAVFTETRTKAILQNPSIYDLSIIRFSIPASSLYLFKMDDPNSLDPNARKYYVTYQRVSDGAFFTSQVLYTPEDNSGERVYRTYQHFLDDVNRALSDLINNPASPFRNIPPQDQYPGVNMIYNEDDRFFSLVATDNVTGHPAPTFYPDNPTGIKVWFNHLLYEFFASIQAFFRGNNNADKMDYNILIKNNAPFIASHPPPNTTTVPNFVENVYPLPGNFGTSFVYYIMTQEINSLWAWQDAVRLVFQSAKLPVDNEYIHSSVGNDISFPFITDFEIPVGNVTDGIFQYYPSGQYRLIDLKSTDPLNNFDCQVYWVDRFGNFNQLLIPPYRAISIKILFQKKYNLGNYTSS